MTYASAPGKIVLWGEYAVLTGAAAGVMALSNRASIRMEPSADKRWHFESKGFFCEPAGSQKNPLLSKCQRLSAEGSIRMLARLLRAITPAAAPVSTAYSPHRTIFPGADA